MSRGTWSDITVTDQFCGAGGSSIGAREAGLRVRMALNHWKLAIETHNTNFPDTDHDCTDVSACDPRRYPSTNILITSPECTTHSPAGGTRRNPTQRDLFRAIEDPATVRSRATMYDVVRFTEYHRYEIVIVENVVEVTRWELFSDWLRMMTHISPGYSYRIVSLNSMHAHPTPQSRDRVYIVFWKKGNRAPDLDLCPPAHCPRCERDVASLQTWKNGRSVGKYRKQYVYTCPICRVEVQPYYYAALNAIDFSVPAERIGDRKRALRPRTLERIQFGLERYGRRPLVVNVKQGARDASRAWPADTRELGTVPTWDGYFGVASPPAFIVNGHMSRRVYGADQPMGTQAASREHDAVCVAPFVVTAGSNDTAPRGADEPIPTMTGSDRLGLVSPFVVQAAYGDSGSRRTMPVDEPLRTVHAGGGNMGVVQSAALISPFLFVARRNVDARPLDGPVPTQCAAGEHFGVVQGSALINLRADLPTYDLDDPLRTATAKGPHDAIIARSPFIVSYYGTDKATGMDAAVPTVTTLDRHAVIEAMAELPSVDDCYFRMLQPHEVGAAMAFPGEYVVLGNKRDRVKQYGNAVTPPAMRWLIRQCTASLAPEVAA